MKINIVGGSGTMGKLHRLIFEKAGHQVIISGRNSLPSMEDAAKNSDVTIISVPISATEDVIKRVAPNCKAIMDFTSLKTFPIKAMLSYAAKDCETAGLHPLYGNVRSIAGRTIVYCKTKKSGKRCEEIARCLERAGAKIIELNPSTHDFLVGGFTQAGRMRLLEAFGLLLTKSGASFAQIYELSPPPARIMLDLLARQVDEKNDSLNEEMKKYNPNTKKIEAHIQNCILKSRKSKKVPAEIREWIGKAELRKAQARIARLFR